MKKKVAITILVALVLCVIGIIVYQNANRELLIGCYYNDDKQSYLEIKEDGTYYFTIRIEMGGHLEGTYEIKDKCLVLHSVEHEDLKFEIGYKKLKVIYGSKMYEKLLPEGMKYKWSEETRESLFEKKYGE